VTKYRTQPPWEFLMTASHNTLQSYELSRLGHASNLRKEIGELLDQWLEENTSAAVARCLINQRSQPPRPELSSPEVTATPAQAETASDNFLADRVSPPRGSNGRR
jgi:hypothetical protein